MSKEIKELSKQNWTSDQNTLEVINTGCLQRIANSLEKISKDYIYILDELEVKKAFIKKLNTQNEALRASNRALKGHITRLKREDINGNNSKENNK